MSRYVTTSRARGFSLVELVLVMVILATLTAIAAPRFAQANARQRLESAADRVISDLQLARTRARASSQTSTITYTPVSGAYNLTGGGGDAMSVPLSDAPYEAKIVSADFGGSESVHFSAYGMPSSAGTVVLSTNAGMVTVVLHANGEATR